MHILVQDGHVASRVLDELYALPEHQLDAITSHWKCSSKILK